MTISLIVVVLTLWKACQTVLQYQNYQNGQSAKRDKHFQQIPQHFNKTVVCSHRCPLRHPAPSSGHWCTGVYIWIFDPGPINPTSILGLCSSGYCRQSIESQMDVPFFNFTEKAPTFTIYDCILRLTSSRKAVKISLWVNRHSVDHENCVISIFVPFYVHIYQEFLWFAVVFSLLESFSNPAAVSELSKRSVSKAWQAFSTNTTTL